MGRTACTEPQYLYKGDLYLLSYNVTPKPPPHTTCYVPGVLYDVRRLEHKYLG